MHIVKAHCRSKCEGYLHTLDGAIPEAVFPETLRGGVDTTPEHRCDSQKHLCSSRKC